MSRPLLVPIGVDDFRKLRETGLEYVDKSALIRELIDRAGVEVVLLPRPRRFGKTLNLSMVRCWLVLARKTGRGPVAPLRRALHLAGRRRPVRGRGHL